MLQIGGHVGRELIVQLLPERDLTRVTPMGSRIRLQTKLEHLRGRSSLFVTTSKALVTRSDAALHVE